ncbi:hypothetical protein Tco_0280404, partial [Tanacetum coccineum]
DFYHLNLSFDESEDEATSRMIIHGNRKKDASNMSFVELLSWAEEEAQIGNSHDMNVVNKGKTQVNDDDDVFPRQGSVGKCEPLTVTEGEDELIDLRKRKTEAKKVPKSTNQKTLSDMVGSSSGIRRRRDVGHHWEDAVNTKGWIAQIPNLLLDRGLSPEGKALRTRRKANKGKWDMLHKGDGITGVVRKGKWYVNVGTMNNGGGFWIWFLIGDDLDIDQWLGLASLWWDVLLDQHWLPTMSKVLPPKARTMPGRPRKIQLGVEEQVVDEPHDAPVVEGEHSSPLESDPVEDSGNAMFEATQNSHIATNIAFAGTQGSQTTNQHVADKNSCCKSNSTSLLLDQRGEKF